ncbi:hypothetical protein V2J09_018183 [Rumex salicifolius]
MLYMASSPDHMDNDGSHNGDENDDSDAPSESSTRNVRGVALLKKIRQLTCQHTKKIQLKCDHYVGYLARDRISIAYKTWKVVPKQTKIDIYDNLMIKDEKTGDYLVEPPKKYPYIDQEAWTSFIQHRCTKDFQYLPDSPSSYSEDQIAKVVEEYVEYIQPILQLELNSPKHMS